MSLNNAILRSHLYSNTRANRLKLAELADTVTLKMLFNGRIIVAV